MDVTTGAKLRIRPAKFGDIPAVANLLHGAFERSKYAGLMQMNMKLAKALVMQAIQRHGMAAAGGTCLFVADDGAVCGFIMGVLQPTYLIGDRVEAQDVFFICAAGAPARAAGLLIDAYQQWALSVPGILSVKLSATDAVQHWKGAARLFERRGLNQVGIIFERIIP